MSEYQSQIAKIDHTYLGVEDHGHLTAVLLVTYGGVGQAVGGYSLDAWEPALGRRVGTAAGMRLVAAIIRACGVDAWEDIRGRTVYVLSDDRGRVVGIENLPTEPGERLIFADVVGGEL